MADGNIEIRVVTPIVTKGFRSAETFEGLAAPGVSVTYSEVDTGPGSIESEFETAFAVPGVVARVLEAERTGADAVVIDCMGDPGLRPAREVVRIPVVGPAQAGMHIAAMLGHTFSVLTVLRRLRAQFENTAALAGLTTKLASVRWVEIPVLELERDIQKTRSDLINQGQKAVEEDGAEALIFGCTGLMGSAQAVREGLLARDIDVPVIDPIPTAVAMAAALVRAGLSHSKTTFQMPPEKQLVGYDTVQLRRPAAE